MYKFLVLLLLPLLSFAFTNCDDDKDVKPMDLTLLDGVWEVVDEGEQDIFMRGCFLRMFTYSDKVDISSTQLQGHISTFWLTATDIQFNDKSYSWSIRETGSQQPMLEVVYEGELDREQHLGDVYSYKITKLNDSHMWWQINTNKYRNTIRFRRRPDIEYN